MVDASAPGTTEMIRQIDHCVEATRLDRRLHEFAVDPIEHELAPPDISHSSSGKTLPT